MYKSLCYKEILTTDANTDSVECLTRDDDSLLREIEEALNRRFSSGDVLLKDNDCGVQKDEFGFPLDILHEVTNICSQYNMLISLD